MGKRSCCLAAHEEDHVGAGFLPAARGVPWQDSAAHGGAGGCSLKEVVAHGEPRKKQTPGQSWRPWRGVHGGGGGLEGAAAHGYPMLD